MRRAFRFFFRVAARKIESYAWVEMPFFISLQTSFLQLGKCIELKFFNMNITQNYSEDKLSMQIRLAVGKEDYEEKVKKALKDYRRKAEIKGFRTGMTPMSLIQKKYGTAALLEQVNTLISEGLGNYIEENKIAVIGKPMPSPEGNDNDFENAEDFVFTFDLILAPEFELNIGSDIHVPYYKVDITDSARKEQIDALCRQNGTLADVPAVEADDYIKVDLKQEGREVKDASLSVKTVPEACKSLFLGKACGDIVSVDVNEICPLDTDRAAFLKIKKDELKTLNPRFECTLTEIKRFIPARQGQQLYDKLFGAGAVTSEEAFLKKVDEQLTNRYAQQSDYVFAADVRKLLTDKAGIRIADDLMKRWLFESNEEKFSKDDIDKDYPNFLLDYSWQLICQKVIKDRNIVITRDDVKAQAKKVAVYRFSMYGIQNFADTDIENYAEGLVNNRDEERRLYENVEQDKVMEFIRGQVSMDVTPISIEDMRVKLQPKQA